MSMCKVEKLNTFKVFSISIQFRLEFLIQICSQLTDLLFISFVVRVFADPLSSNQSGPL